VAQKWSEPNNFQAIAFAAISLPPADTIKCGENMNHYGRQPPGVEKSTLFM
jgi:hypothetical protein